MLCSWKIFSDFLIFPGVVGEECKLNGNGKVRGNVNLPLGQRHSGVAAVSSIFSGQNVLGTWNIRIFINKLGIQHFRNMLSFSAVWRYIMHWHSTNFLLTKCRRKYIPGECFSIELDMKCTEACVSHGFENFWDGK